MEVPQNSGDNSPERGPSPVDEAKNTRGMDPQPVLRAHGLSLGLLPDAPQNMNLTVFPGELVYIQPASQEMGAFLARVLASRLGFREDRASGILDYPALAQADKLSRPLLLDGNIPGIPDKAYGWLCRRKPVLKILMGSADRSLERGRLQLRLEAAGFLERLGFGSARETRRLRLGELSPSKGRLLAWACVLLDCPLLVVAREPFRDLDDQDKTLLAGLIASFRQEFGTAFVLISPSSSLARQLADQGWVLRGGELVPLPQD